MSADAKTPTITEFLEARIAEDEAAVAKPSTDLPITRVHHPHAIKDVPGHLGATVEIPAHDQLEVRPVAATWNADPSRILAECEAKRAIIAQAEVASGDREQLIGEVCAGEADSAKGYAADPGKLILQALASVYSDHPDYQDAWAL